MAHQVVSSGGRLPHQVNLGVIESRFRELLFGHFVDIFSVPGITLKRNGLQSGGRGRDLVVEAWGDWLQGFCDLNV